MNVILIPISTKAEAHLANSLRGNPICSLEQLRDGEIFVTSPDQTFCAWIKTESDPDWAFTLTGKHISTTEPTNDGITDPDF